jgi:hypothetical protein
MKEALKPALRKEPDKHERPHFMSISSRSEYLANKVFVIAIRRTSALFWERMSDNLFTFRRTSADRLTTQLRAAPLPDKDASNVWCSG